MGRASLLEENHFVGEWVSSQGMGRIVAGTVGQLVRSSAMEPRVGAHWDTRRGADDLELCW
jgi:hypothetical protein